MIVVNITYTRKLYKSGREVFIYKDVIIKGHSSDGSINSIKCCAGVTAITCGLINLLKDDLDCNVEINKGYFHYHLVNYTAELNYAINALIYQLDSISTIYPSFFKDFIWNEEKV